MALADDDCNSFQVYDSSADGEASCSVLVPSKLGCQDYWEEYYSLEVLNFEKFGCPGEIWFGKAAQFRVVKWLSESPLASQRAWRVLELGSGNGCLLLALARKGFTNLCGIDYSSGAIALAQKLHDSEKRELEQSCLIQFEVADILVQPILKNMKNADVVIDKGTYDAISLMADSLQNRKRYQHNLVECLRSGVRSARIFVLVSCNWTKAELMEQFSEFNVLEELPAPEIQFGGRTGQTVTTLVFKLKPEV